MILMKIPDAELSARFELRPPMERLESRLYIYRGATNPAHPKEVLKYRPTQTERYRLMRSLEQQHPETDPRVIYVDFNPID